MKFLKRLFGGSKQPSVHSDPPLLEPILSKLSAFKKTAYVPLIEEADSSTSSSKFSGRPYISRDHPWPTCPSCHAKMQLFWQQDLSESGLNHNYPATTGLLQLFYCVTEDPLCEDELESFSPFSKATYIRVVDAHDEVEDDMPETHFPARSITGWEVVDDYPGWDELKASGFELSEEESDVYFKSYPLTGEKIGGWPHWVQSVEYPTCTTCSAEMQYLLQIDSEQNVPYMFGDVGVGHLSYCATHPDVMSFHWACS